MARVLLEAQSRGFAQYHADRDPTGESSLRRNGNHRNFEGGEDFKGRGGNSLPARSTSGTGLGLTLFYNGTGTEGAREGCLTRAVEGALSQFCRKGQPVYRASVSICGQRGTIRLPTARLGFNAMDGLGPPRVGFILFEHFSRRHYPNWVSRIHARESANRDAWT